MQSFSARLALVVSGFVAALALIIGHSALESTPGPGIDDNGWSAPALTAPQDDNGWSGPAPATPQDDNGWS
ncbi:hypothetical protein [Streptomyces sp. NPDC049916]|uniref:hypothetical protein n=1 Tax=unclassified Streptomyces TaxID=2593676 RepID=UPI003442CBFC